MNILYINQKDELKMQSVYRENGKFNVAIPEPHFFVDIYEHSLPFQDSNLTRELFNDLESYFKFSNIFPTNINKYDFRKQAIYQFGNYELIPVRVQLSQEEITHELIKDFTNFIKDKFGYNVIENGFDPDGDRIILQFSSFQEMEQFMEIYHSTSESQENYKIIQLSY